MHALAPDLALVAEKARQMRLEAEGQIPDECVNCDIFQRYPTV